jgi:hypothetical protein
MGYTISTHGSIITMGVIFLPCKDSPSHERGSIRGVTNQIMKVTGEIKTRALRIKEFIFQINSNLF